MRLANERLIRLVAAIFVWLSALFMFFFVQPDSLFVIALFCVLVASGMGLLLWVLLPVRFALYGFFGTGYLLFLATEHIVRIDLILYGAAIVVLTELFIGRRLPMLQ